MEIPETLRCLFTGQLDHRDGSYVIEIPDQELHHGTFGQDETYRIAIMSATSQGEGDGSTTESPQEPAPDQPPVETGDTRVVEIESLGDQGDGIARVNRGFIVPDTEPNERVRVKITDVRESVAFADIIERLDYDE